MQLYVTNNLNVFLTSPKSTTFDLKLGKLYCLCSTLRTWKHKYENYMKYVQSFLNLSQSKESTNIHVSVMPLIAFCLQWQYIV